MGISASQIGRILGDLDIKSHRMRSWIIRPDNPRLWGRRLTSMALSDPANVLVLSVDERTGIGARSRTRPTQPVAPSLDAHGGGIFTATDLDRNTAANFIAFLDDLDAKVAAELDVQQRLLAHSPRHPLVVRGRPVLPPAFTQAMPHG